MYVTLQNTYAKSIETCNSACHLLMFNVEDILALPQLKEGRFTKNIQDINITNAIQEVINI